MKALSGHTYTHVPDAIDQAATRRLDTDRCHVNSVDNFADGNNIAIPVYSSYYKIAWGVVGSI